MAHEAQLFLRQLLSKPGQISAISPSSRFLARAMAQTLGPQTGRVVEFGPGTGQLTRGILAAGVAPKDLTLLELSNDFVAHLKESFPGVSVHQAGAQAVSNLVEPGVGAVLSGLPLLSIPDPIVESILRGAFDVLKPGGMMIQFTYGPKPPVSIEMMKRLGLIAIKGPKVWANLPPARVYHFQRAG